MIDFFWAEKHGGGVGGGVGGMGVGDENWRWEGGGYEKLPFSGEGEMKTWVGGGGGGGRFERFFLRNIVVSVRGWGYS